MAKSIVYKNVDGTLEILRGCISKKSHEGEIEYLTRIAKTTYGNRKFNIVDIPHSNLISNKKYPYDLNFRKAWTVENNKLIVNLDKAKQIWKDIIRDYANKAILKLNEEIQLYLEQADLESIKELGEVKQILKNVHTTVDEIDFKSLDHLKSYWPTILFPAPDFVLNIPMEQFN